MRANWVVQLIILGVTVLVFRLVLERTGPVFAVVVGAVTFLVPTIIWFRMQSKDFD